LILNFLKMKHIRRIQRIKRSRIIRVVRIPTRYAIGCGLSLKSVVEFLGCGRRGVVERKAVFEGPFYLVVKSTLHWFRLFMSYDQIMVAIITDLDE